MNKGLDLIQRQQIEIIDGYPTGNIYIGITKEELTELEQELKDYQEIKTYMQQYEIENIEELRCILHNDWVIRQKFKTDTANVAKALEIIKKKKVNTRAFIEILEDEWTWEQYMDEEDDINTGGHQFSRDRLTQEEYDLLKEVLL